jgi:hypothetical protein
MVHLDALWGVPRTVTISGKSISVPFGVDLEPGFVSPITHWIQCSGYDFTAKKVKVLKVWALHILAGERNYSEPWFKKIQYRGYTIPKLNIFKYFLDHLTDLKSVKKVLVVLNSYKLRLVGSPSLSSIVEIEKSELSDPYIPHLRKYVQLPHVPNQVLEPELSVNTRTKYSDDFGGTHCGPFGTLDDELPAQIALDWKEMQEEPQCLGRLVPIPDKGKWRNILVGHFALQLKTKRLADWLRQWLWSLPQIASGDQSKMSTFILESLKKGRYMMSIDLSEATDRLSRDLQIKLLISMGVPNSYLKFLNLPFFYDKKTYLKSGKGLGQGYYVNGQPMGLYLSFPMFELAHFVILSFATAIRKDADFCICGDDVVIACEEKDSSYIYNRYKNLIERFGGEISSGKTVLSNRFAEGVGAIFLKGIQKEIRIPSGRLSALEAFTPGTWLNKKIVQLDPIGRAILFPWLQTKEYKRYTYDQRKAMNEFFINHDLSSWRLDSLRALDKAERMPQIWPAWEEGPSNLWMMNSLVLEDQVRPLRWVGLSSIQHALVANKIITLLKKDSKDARQQRK